jgi:hypothetical protein
MKTRQSAIRATFVEFVVVLITSVIWNYVRKTGESVLDAFGIALLTAVLFYAFYRESSE